MAIYPKLLDHPDDVEGLLRGLDWVRKLASTPPFSSQVIQLIDVPAANAGRDADMAFLRKATVPSFHLSARADGSG